MVVPKIFQQVHSELEELQDVFNRDNTAQNDLTQKAVNRFLKLEKEFIQHENHEIDDATRKKVIGIINHIKNTPEIETMLGTLQFQFFIFLNKIELDLKKSVKTKAQSVQGVDFDRLERQ